MGYSFCKIINLGQKIKLHKTHQKQLYNHIIVILCKKTALKKIKNSKNEIILKIDKNGLHPWAKGFAKSSVSVKKSNCAKHTKNDSIITLQLFYAKKRFKKDQIFEK